MTLIAAEGSGKDVSVCLPNYGMKYVYCCGGVDGNEVGIICASSVSLMKVCLLFYLDRHAYSSIAMGYSCLCLLAVQVSWYFVVPGSGAFKSGGAGSGDCATAYYAVDFLLSSPPTSSPTRSPSSAPSRFPTQSPLAPSTASLPCLTVSLRDSYGDGKLQHIP